MKNINYDLIKLLHCKMDSIWRLENYYIKDAKDARCHSITALEAMLSDEKKHAQKLIDEIKMRMENNLFD